MTRTIKFYLYCIYLGFMKRDCVICGIWLHRCRSCLQQKDARQGEGFCQWEQQPQVLWGRGGSKRDSWVPRCLCEWLRQLDAAAGCRWCGRPSPPGPYLSTVWGPLPALAYACPEDSPRHLPCYLLSVVQEKVKWSERESHSVVFDSLRPHGLYVEFSRPEYCSG